MADPTTILEVADLEQANDLAAQTAANTALVNATAALAAAQSQQQELAAQLQTLQQLEADIRRQLAATAMPADGEALLEQLGQAIVDKRATQAQLATAEAQAGQSRLDVETAQAALASSTTAAGVAASAREQALHDDTERAAWKSAVAAAPLKDVKAQATTAANTANEPLHSAKARIEADIPADLLARARDRGAKARSLVDLARTAAENAEDRVAAQAGSDGGVAGKVVKAQTAFDRAVLELRAYVFNALPDYQRAVALLAAIPSAPSITQAEADRINDTTIVNDGKAAAAKEGDRDQARADVAAAQADLDLAILKAKADDIDADPSTVTAVQTAHTALEAATTALETAQTAYTDAMKEALDLWEATVPDTTWRLLANYDEANAILQRLKTTDPSALATAATSKEGDLVTALIADEKSERTEEYLADVAERAAGRLATTTNAAPAATFGAIRGDGA